MDRFTLLAAAVLLVAATAGGLDPMVSAAAAQSDGVQSDGALDDSLFDSADAFGGADVSPGGTATRGGKSKSPSDGDFGGLNFGGLGQSKPFGSSLGGLLGPSEPELKASVSPAAAGPGQVLTLRLKLTIPPGAHVAAQPQQADWAGATQIVVKASPSLEAIDTDFRPDHEPELAEAPGLGPLPQFENEVVWSKRFRVLPGAAGPATLSGMVDYQICDERCVPYRTPFEVRVDLTAAAADPAAGYRFRPAGGPDGVSPVEIQAELLPPRPTEGTEVVLAVTMDFNAGWHGYGLTAAEGQRVEPTTLELLRTEGLKPLDEAWRPIQSAETVKNADGVAESRHDGRVTFQRRFVATGEPPAVSGRVRYQVCSDSTCLPPAEADFGLGGAYAAAASDVVPSQFFADPRPFVASDAAGDALPATARLPMSRLLLFAFLGGLLLNVMPCVLPVLAIKVMGFVQQAGESRRQILVLNAAYSLGVVLVFAVLAGLAAFAGQGFGGQFASVPFKVTMAVIVFLSGLSLLGVFEIPLPGYLGSVGTDQKEGPGGAFLTGGLATVLATPCTGPFIGPALAGTATQPAAMTFLLWITAGVGMASPYLVAGVFPRVVNFLPRPGAWMVWFKQASGFVLMGTVAWLVAFTGIPGRLVGPLLVFLVGLAFAAWVWGTFRPHATAGQRLPVHAGSVAVTVATGFLALWLGTEPEPDDVLPWRPFSDAALADLLDDGETVLVDFTADWCLICKQNETVALNTDATIEFVAEHDVKTLMADFTEQPPAIKVWLDRFETAGVPLTVIFPRGSARDAIVLKGPFTQSTLLRQLEKAVGPERVASL